MALPQDQIQQELDNQLYKREAVPPTMGVDLSNTLKGPITGNIELASGYIASTNYLQFKKGWKISEDGKAEFTDIDIGQRHVTVDPGESIQDAIDSLTAGVVTLRNGIHYPTGNIVLKSSVYLRGENRASTIVDFAGGAYGIIATGSNIYTTGTVTVANNGTAVTGLGTAWATNAVAGMYILIGGVWHPITVVGSDTSITIGLNYAGAPLSGASYVIGVPVYDCYIQNLTTRNSTASSMKFSYSNNGGFQNVEAYTSLVGFELNVTAQCQLDHMNGVANYTNFKFTDTSYLAFWSAGSIDALSGEGMNLTRVTGSKIDSFFNLNSNGVGIKMTNCAKVLLNGCVSSECTSHGFELVSNNSDCVLLAVSAENNGGDGIKLTATTDSTFLTNSLIRGNTGYGLNIAASTDDFTDVTGNIFDTNGASACNNSGTGTVIRGNIGLSDNFSYTGGSATSGFGSGADGDYTLGASLGAVTGLFSYAATVYTLLRDANFQSLTIENGYTLRTNGYKIYATSSVTNAGTITNSGYNGTNGGEGTLVTQGTAGLGGNGTTAGSLPASAAGGNGALGAPPNTAAYPTYNGNAGTSTNPSIGSAGSDSAVSGAYQSQTGGAAGAGGTATAENCTINQNVTAFPITLTAGVEADGTFKYFFKGATSGATLSCSASSGGGPGGCGGTPGFGTPQGYGGGGGGGGGTGGIVYIVAVTLTNSGSILSTGGNAGTGGAATATSGTPGQAGATGGAGTGGVILLGYMTLADTGTISVAAGTGNGGNAGKIYKCKV